MKKTVAFIALAASASFAAASPLDLFARSSFNGTNYDYSFTLRLTNTDGSWVSGDGWGWIVFGEKTATVDFDSFVGTPGSMLDSPWTDFELSEGAHHGPTLSSIFDVWTPTAVGQSVHWSGTADVDLPEEFQWSSLYTGGAASEIDRKAILNMPDGEGTPNPVPEPTAFAGIGIGIVAFLRRRKSRA